MAQRHVFGRSITFNFIPIAYDEDVAPYSLISARIYSSEPTNAQKANTDTGHIEEVVSWTSVSTTEKKIVFAALTDSNPYDSKFDYEKYYIVVNFKYEASSPTVFTSELIHVYRPDSLTSKIRVLPEDLIKIESKFSEFYQTSELEDKIQVAIDLINKKLLAKGINKRQTFNREDLNTATKFQTLAITCMDLSGESNTDWRFKSSYYEKFCDQLLDTLAVNIDKEFDDKPEANEVNNTNVIWLAR